MNEDTFARLKTISDELNRRASELSPPGIDQNHDMATLMSALAVTMEAVRFLGVSVNSMREMDPIRRD